MTQEDEAGIRTRDRINLAHADLSQFARAGDIMRATAQAAHNDRRTLLEYVDKLRAALDAIADGKIPPQNVCRYAHDALKVAP